MAPKSSSTKPKSHINSMGEWPESWAGFPEDVPIGESLVAELRPFVVHLEQTGLTPKTVLAHVNGLWVIGGEIIRRLDNEPRPHKINARALILSAIEYGEAPWATGVSVSDQNGIDATARRLLRFMKAQKQT